MAEATAEEAGRAGARRERDDEKVESGGGGGGESDRGLGGSGVENAIRGGERRGALDAATAVTADARSLPLLRATGRERAEEDEARRRRAEERIIEKSKNFVPVWSSLVTK